MRISKSGTYQIIYNDFYIKNGIIVLYNETNNTDLVRIALDSPPSGKYYPISFNAIFEINLTDSQDHNEISIFIETSNNAYFDGKGYSSFFIKYLHD